MIPLLMNISLTLLIPMIIVLFAHLISMKPPTTREKLSPFECGFDPNHHARTPFSLRFFLLAIIFVVFDIEIILLLPLPIMPHHHHPMFSLPSVSAFLLILILGLLHEWNEGSLEWTP